MKHTDSALNLTQYEGGDVPKWIGTPTTQDPTPLGTYNGDMFKIDAAIEDLRTSVGNITPTHFIPRTSDGGTVVATDIGTGAVTTVKLETSTSTSTGITTPKLANGAVTEPKLAVSAVGTNNIADYADPGTGNQVVHGITTTKYADKSITGSKIALATIEAENLAPSATTVIGIPTGIMVPFIGGPGSIPAGWLPCDGTSRTVAAFPALAAFFVANSGSFSLPDLRGRVPMGLDNMGTAANRVTSTEADTLNTGLGAESVALTSDQLATHTHTQAEHTHAQTIPHTHSIPSHDHPLATSSNSLNVDSGGGRVNIVTGGSGSHDGLIRGLSSDIATSSPLNVATKGPWVSGVNTALTLDPATPVIAGAGAGNAHSNMQPTLTVNYIIKT